MKLTYILAASHSGSTLLSMLLGSHPQIATVGELKLSSRAMGDIEQYRCSCGEFIRACRFWRKVKEGLAVLAYDFDITDAGTDYRAVNSSYARWLLGPLHRGKLLEILRDGALSISPTWKKQLPEIHRRNAALASSICSVTKAEVIVDSSKVALRLKYLLRNPEFDVKVIHLIRDGRAVALTYMDPAGFADARDPALRGGGSGGRREKERLSMAQAAHQWRRSNEEAEHLLRGLDKSQWIEVRYEDLCRDTENTLRRLFEFIGVDPDKHARDFRTVEYHVVGNGMRLDTTSEIQLDERWRETLTEQDLRVFDTVAGKMNRRYGYKYVWRTDCLKYQIR
jgi:hypothetical protein